MFLVHLLQIKKELEKFKERGHSRHLSKPIDKVCFQHDIVYGNFKGVNRRTAAN